MTDDRGNLDLTKVIEDCHNLVDELKAKLKLKANEILDLRKQIDYAREETQLLELKYKKLEETVENHMNDRLNKIRGANND